MRRASTATALTCIRIASNQVNWLARSIIRVNASCMHDLLQQGEIDARPSSHMASAIPNYQAGGETRVFERLICLIGLGIFSLAESIEPRGRSRHDSSLFVAS